MQHGLPQDLDDITIVLKLGKDIAGSASVGETDIHDVHAINDEPKGVGQPECPSTGADICLVIAYMGREWQKCEQYVQGIEIEHGSQVKSHAAN